MPLDLAEAPARSVVPARSGVPARESVVGPAPRHAAPAPASSPASSSSRTSAARPVATDPPVRPRARHRRPGDLPALADRWSGRLLVLSVAVFAACGPAHAFGHTDLVYHAVLVGLTAGALAVPLGLLALRGQPPTAPRDPHAPEI